MLMKDQVVLITGAGRGWGRGIAQQFGRQGAKVIAVSRTQAEIDLTVAAVQAENSIIEGLSVDVSDDAAMHQLKDYVLGKYGRLDVLVNNAAVMLFKTFEESTQAEIDRVLEINLRAVLLGCKLFLEPMKAQGGGALINVSSRAGVMPFEKETVYCAAKYALEGFTKSLAQEIAQYNISTNTITPGGKASGKTLKPTSMTQADYDALSPQEQARYGDPILYSEAFVYLGLQRGDGLTGARVEAYELSKRIRQEGYNISVDPVRGY
jgi:NAD(P)-dependent dehydrogenase (short-subunit alcohol dehydrogenase family)